MELCVGGDLLNYVRKRRKLKEEVARHLFRQIVEGLKYCHSKSVLHRDIKLVKICDFGVSKLVNPRQLMKE
jgi:serine/threonine protein kinase